MAKARGVRGPGLGLRRGFQEPAQQIEGGLYQHRSLPVRRGENAAQRGNGELVQRREARGHGGERLEHVPGVRGEQRVRHLRRPHPQRRRGQRPRPSRRSLVVALDDDENSLEHQVESLAPVTVVER